MTALEDVLKTKFRNLNQKTIINLIVTSSLINNKLQKILKQYDIAPPQYNVLRILKGQYPNAVSVNIIKERMMDANSDVSRIIDRLYKKGLVLRKECPHDRRQKDVSLTQKGMELLNKINLTDFEDELISVLNDDEKIQLNYLLDKIRNNM
jgi:DNA-binding MarR family transcriptional regulator